MREKRRIGHHRRQIRGVLSGVIGLDRFRRSYPCSLAFPAPFLSLLPSYACSLPMPAPFLCLLPPPSFFPPTCILLPIAHTVDSLAHMLQVQRDETEGTRGGGYMSYEEEDTCLCVNIFERIRAKKLTQVSRLFNRRVPFGSDGCNCVGSLFRGALV